MKTKHLKQIKIKHLKIPQKQNLYVISGEMCMEEVKNLLEAREKQLLLLESA